MRLLGAWPAMRLLGAWPALRLACSETARSMTCSETGLLWDWPALRLACSWDWRARETGVLVRLACSWDWPALRLAISGELKVKSFCIEYYNSLQRLINQAKSKQSKIKYPINSSIYHPINEWAQSQVKDMRLGPKDITGVHRVECSYPQLCRPSFMKPGDIPVQPLGHNGLCT